MLSIGILLPRSSYYETISFDMFEGLRSGLKNAGLGEIRVVTENIGYGAERQQCYRSAERLLMEENVAVVFAYIGHRTAQLLRPLFMAANRLLIVLDAGANMPLEWPASPNVLYHSLHNALGGYLTGKMATRDGYLLGGLVTGYFDGGFLHTFSTTKGFVDHGGKMGFNHATGYNEQDFSMAPLVQHLETYPGSALLSVFSGDFCQWFYRDIKAIFGNNLPPVYSLPFGFEELMLANTSYPGDGVRGIAAWSRELNNEENKKFCAALEDAGRNACLFSLLGWEAAQLVPFIIDAMKECKNNAAAASEKIRQATFDSPRGRISFHAESNHSIAPMYEAKLEAGTDGNCRLVLTGEAEGTAEGFEKLVTAELENAISGWYNSYTCN